MLTKHGTKSLAKSLAFLAVTLALSGCAHEGTSGTSCAGWKRIIASSHDTDETLRQVEENNQYGRSMGCWK